MFMEKSIYIRPFSSTVFKLKGYIATIYDGCFFTRYVYTGESHDGDRCNRKRDT